MGLSAAAQQAADAHCQQAVYGNYSWLACQLHQAAFCNKPKLWFVIEIATLNPSAVVTSNVSSDQECAQHHVVPQAVLWCKIGRLSLLLGL